MSCRVFNKSIENSIMWELIKDAKKNMKERIDIHYKKNNKNLILKDILNSLGFSKQDNYGTFSINLKKN